MPETPAEPEDRFFTSSRLRLHYTAWGDESKPVLVLVHGNRDHARSWDFVAPRFLDRFAVYALDLRGHGDSDWVMGGAYGVTGYVSDLLGLLDTLDRPREQVVLLGHSMGARVVLDTAAAFPERMSKVIAIEGFGRVAAAIPPAAQTRNYVRVLRDLETRQPRPYATLEAAEARLREENKRLSPELAHHLTQHGTRRREDGTYVWKFDNYVRLGTVPEWDYAETLTMWGGIKVPVLFIGGEYSWSTRHPGREKLPEAVPTARIQIIPGADHWVHHDQPDAFVAAVREYLE